MILVDVLLKTFLDGIVGLAHVDVVGIATNFNHVTAVLAGIERRTGDNLKVLVFQIAD